MEPRLSKRPAAGTAHGLLHSICQLVVGFAWILVASLFLVVGVGLAILGVAGGFLVRARPETGNVINYDPSRVATFSPLPIAIGLLLLLAYVLRVRKLSR